MHIIRNKIRYFEFGYFSSSLFHLLVIIFHSDGYCIKVLYSWGNSCPPNLLILKRFQEKIKKILSKIDENFQRRPSKKSATTFWRRKRQRRRRRRLGDGSINLFQRATTLRTNKLERSSFPHLLSLAFYTLKRRLIGRIFSRVRPFYERPVSDLDP
jgi:hypothetical protein